MPIDGGALAGAALNAFLNNLSGGGGSPDPAYGYGYQGGSSFNQSGSSNQSTSSSVQFPDTVWGVQSPYLQNMYQQASQMAAGGGNQAQAQGLFEQGIGGMETLMNPGMNPLMEVYQQQMQQGLEQNILPTIQREAMGAGMMGGSRQGTAEGLALQQAQREQTNFAAQLYSGDMDRMLGATSLLPNLMQAGLGVPWFGLNQLAGILGAPVVLGGGGISSSQSTGSSFGVGGSEQFGENFSGPDGENPYVPGAGLPPEDAPTPPGGNPNDYPQGNN